jgi:hypothetical protein
MKCSAILFCLFFYCFTYAQNDAVVKTLNPQKCQNVKIKVPNSLIKHEAWENGGIRVDITVTSTTPSEILDKLLKSGRYELQGKVIDNDFYVSAPNMDIPLTLNGKEFKEDVNIKISTPEYFVMNDKADLYKDVDENVVRSRSDTAEEMEEMLKKMKQIREDVNVHIRVVSTSSEKNVKVSNYTFGLNGKKYTADKIVFPQID